MTNEEKIKEIVREQPYATQNDNYATMIEYGARKMDEWKDEQFEKQKKEFLNKACEWLTENIDISKRPSHIVMDFRKYMEDYV